MALLPFPACKEELQNGGLVQLFPSGLASQDRFMHYSQRTKECPQLHAILWTS
ncbi:hypothetical protein WI238_01690 [Salmonella enterica subsp. enterica serovar Infantis]